MLFCSLGTWQLYRLQWKLALINEINDGLSSEPVFYSKINIKNYQKVKFKGEFNFEKQIFLYSLNDNGVPGYEIITPLQTQSNEILLINRGWIKEEMKSESQKNINLIDTNSFSGIIKKISKSNPFKPDNDLKNNIWFTVNLEELENYMGFDLNNYILYLENSHNKILTPKKISPNLPNNHLKYSITWYSVALSILLYFLYFRKRQ